MPAPRRLARLIDARGQLLLGQLALGRLALALLALGQLARPSRSEAQDVPPHHGLAADSLRRWSAGAMGIALVSRAAPGVAGETVTEGYLTQPMLMGGARLANGRLQAVATLNLEGLTLARGEINPGGYGEGFVDRRHPHTYLHEAMLGTQATAGRWSFSLFGGKGVIPFGTDDPMLRAFAKYPVNHHLAQVMERVQLTAAVRWQRATLEGARFNGDEPEGPSDWPNAGRALDSWSTRLTVEARPGLELAASAAGVRSPEFATGEGLDQAKASASLRLARPTRRLRCALVEWARTEESNGERAVFAYRSLLAEGVVAASAVDVALRLERTERPEEDRLDDPYRSVRPLLDFNVLGRTRWDIATVHVAARLPRRIGGAARPLASPFIEVAWLRPRALARPAAIDPEVLFDATQLWLFSAGVRVHVGTMRPRWGRYGAAVPRTS